MRQGVGEVAVRMGWLLVARRASAAGRWYLGVATPGALVAETAAVEVRRWGRAPVA